MKKMCLPLQQCTQIHQDHSGHHWEGPPWWEQGEWFQSKSSPTLSTNVVWWRVLMIVGAQWKFVAQRIAIFAHAFLRRLRVRIAFLRMRSVRCIINISTIIMINNATCRLVQYAKLNKYCNKQRNKRTKRRKRKHKEHYIKFIKIRCGTNSPRTFGPCIKAIVSCT